MFHRHQWGQVSAQPMERGPGLLFDQEKQFDPRYRTPVTLVLYRCAKCGAHKTATLAGWWPIAPEEHGPVRVRKAAP